MKALPMKKILFSALVLTGVASQAHAQSDHFPYWYIGANLGYSSHQDSDWGSGNDIEYDSGYSFSTSLGYRPESLPNARFEVEAMYQTHPIDEVNNASNEGDSNISAIMFNAYADLGDEMGWNPYIGAGIGGARVALDSNTVPVDDSEHVFAYQVKAGLAYRPSIMYNLDFTLGYRFFNTTDAEIAGTDLDTMSHSVEIGTRMQF